MANEFNAIQCKSYSPTFGSFPIWDELFAAMIEYDPYDGLNGRVPVREKSILQRGNELYNYSRSLLTHFSVQGFADSNSKLFWNRYNVSKPVILDAVDSEGNISESVGNDLTAKEETDRFWMAIGNGNMCGHSESLLPNKIDNVTGTAVIWKNFGGVLRGESYNKIGWFNRYMINVVIHPSFDEMESRCLKGTDTHCFISSMQSGTDFYLIHWSDYGQHQYDRKLEVSLGNTVYEVSAIEFMDESIQSLNKSVNGSTFAFEPPYIPYNIQVVDENSRYGHLLRMSVSRSKSNDQSSFVLFN